MSGRGRGGHGGRNGGRRSGNDNKTRSGSQNKPSSAQNKKDVSDYVYYIGSSKQASDYEITTEFLINHIQKEYEFGSDIATALNQLEAFNLNKFKPRLETSTSGDATVKAAEEKQFEMEFRAKFERYTIREETYNNNLTKAYAFLWERCSKAMKNKIEARKDFATKIKDDPIELLKAIKEHALNYQENKLDMVIILDAMRALHNTKQKDGESLQDYTKRFKVARDVLVSHLGGPIIFSKIIEKTDAYKSEDAERIKAEQKVQFNRYLAVLYLENADQAKYGSILSGLSTQLTLKNDQYPKTITEANDVLSNHRFDTTPSPKKPAVKQPKDNKQSDDKSKEKEDELNLSFAQMEGRCYCCGKPGHMSTQCRHKNRPKEEWAMNKAQAKENSHAQVTTTTTTNAPTTAGGSGNQGSEKTVGWSAAQFQFYQADKMHDVILLDNQSTTTLFCNPSLVQDIKPSKETMYLSTNGGILATDSVAEVPEWGQVWYNPSAITNIFGFSDMVSKHRVTYDSEAEDAFIVHLPDKLVKFSKTSEGLYAFKPSKLSRSVEHQSHVTTLEENVKFYSPRQFERAKQARDFYHAMGTPSIQDIKAIIRMNLIKDNPITTEDVDLAERIFGPDVGALKGKTTRKKPVPVIDSYIDIPKELIAAQHRVVLCIDGIKVNGLPFLTTISRNLYYRTATFLANLTMEEHKKALAEVLRMYNHGGLKVHEIRCDNEFRPIIDHLSDHFGIRVNYANPQEHVPEIERNNRVIKERVRATYHRLPYERLPRVMVKTLVTETPKKLNFFPARHGVSKYYSPRMIVHQENLHYDKHCRYAFGTYVEAHDEPSPSNDNQPRTLYCIYLRYVASHQGGHELLHLPTNRIITRRKVTPVPITPAVIKQVHALADQEGMPSGLKINNRTGLLLYDSAWIAGVDYDEEEFDDEDYEPDEQEQDDDEDPNEDDYDEMDPNEIYDDDNNQASNPTDVEQAQGQDQVADNEVDEEGPVADDEVEEVENDEEQIEEVKTTRSGRVSRPPAKFSEYQSHLQTQGIEPNEYSLESGKVIATVMSFAQTYSLNKGLKVFKERGHAAAKKEMRQLHDRVVWEPIAVSELTTLERKRALESLIFLNEKRDGTVKARTCANGSTQRSYIGKEDATSPTVMLESIMLTATIDAKQGRDVMTADIPNAFVQTDIDLDGERIIMKIRGALVDMLVDIAPDAYAEFVTFQHGQKVLYVRMLKALYGMLTSSLLYYKKFKKDMEEIGFELNPYDPCVANRVVNGKQHTVVWHVDDLKSSHQDKHVNDEFHKWLQQKYGDEKIGQVKAVRGHTHDYLGVVLDFSTPGMVGVDMRSYIQAMVEDFSEQLGGNERYPWNDKLFKVDEKSKKLGMVQAEEFHTFVAKALFLSKRARVDIQPVVAFLTTRVKGPNQSDWCKLKRMMNFLKTTINDVMKLSADDTQTIKWFVDAAFAVHPDFKSHTGAVMQLGNGAIQCVSTKQKVNARSSTEAELISLDDTVGKILWTKMFIEAQGFKVNANVVFRDNQSSMKLEANGKASSGKRTRHFHIKYFYITDLIKRGEVQIEYCPTDDMLADYMTKPLTGIKFRQFRNKIMNLEAVASASRSVLAKHANDKIGA